VNGVVIFFLPAGATQRDFEVALRDCRKPAKIDKALPKTSNIGKESCDTEDLPLWTWFLPNPRP